MTGADPVRVLAVGDPFMPAGLFTAALAGLGDAVTVTEMQIASAEAMVDGLGFELIQPVSGPSIYQEFLDTHGEGVQHIACMKHSTEDSSLMQEHWRSNGAEVLMSGRIGDSIEFYYLDTAPMLKFVLESGSGHAIDLKPTYVYP